MIIDEAIKINKRLIEHADSILTKEEVKAIKLGNKALEREQSWRQRYPHQSHLPFLGETEEYISKYDEPLPPGSEPGYQERKE